jgi:hypothetical protein
VPELAPARPDGVPALPKRIPAGLLGAPRSGSQPSPHEPEHWRVRPAARATDPGRSQAPVRACVHARPDERLPRLQEPS